MVSVCEYSKSMKNLEMASVGEFLETMKKLGNGFSMRIFKIYQKTWKWLQYENFQNLEMPSVFTFSKSTKKTWIWLQYENTYSK